MDSPELRALWEMIERRAKGGDRETIDREIWDRFGAEHAVMATDLSGFSRQVAKFGIIHFLQTIHEQQNSLLPIVESNGGRLVKTEADSMLILYPNAAAALASALAMQAACRALNQGRAPEDHVLLCVGIGFGRILVIGKDEIFGHEVNLASKLGEDIAKANEILCTRGALTALGDTVTCEEHRADYAGESICWRVRY